MTDCEACDKEDCASKKGLPGESEEDRENRQKMLRRLCRIDKKILVMSGKGGVGKSTVAVNLAISLALEGKRVGLLDVDFHGPSIPTMLKPESTDIMQGEDGLIPLELGGLKFISIGYLLKNSDDPVIWRGPMKNGAVQQLLRDVVWGDLDYLIIDAPPGTGDEPLSVIQSIGNVDGAVLVTTPQKVSAADVSRSIRFCHAMELPVIGIVENMSGFICPHCEKVTEIFSTGAGEELAAKYKIPFLGKIPLDPRVGQSGDEGTPFVYRFGKTETAKAFRPVIDILLNKE
jgi:Mrp family chromosome partitioning ATPase